MAEETSLPNARFNQLKPTAGLKKGFLGAVLNMDTNVTESFDFGDLLVSNITGNFEWLPDTPYANEYARTWQGLWWQAQSDVPANIVPGTDGGVYWQQIGKSPSGLVFWQAGVYPQDTVVVLKDMSIALDETDVRMYLLHSSVPRPFVSSDFNTELSDGKWILLFAPGAGGGVVTLREVFEYSSNLFTEQAISFVLPITNLLVAKTDAINSINYDVGLDANPIVYTNYTSLTDVQSWIAANATGSNIYWIRINVVYKTGRKELSQVILIYQASA